MIKPNISFKPYWRINSYLTGSQYEKKETAEDNNEKKDIEGLVYIQMRLPVDKITKEFEENIKNSAKFKNLNVKIREASENDLTVIINIYNKAWMTSNTPFSPLSFESIKNLYNFPDTTILIAKIYGIDAGFLILDFEGQKQEIGFITALGILPRFQRKGIGSVLGVASWDYFKNKEIKELRTEVYINNHKSKKFLKFIGFEEFGRECYFKED
ncbi:MAG: GNAT family N-acetyltransferase [Candidatus Hermodarchaeota archaeon]